MICAVAGPACSIVIVSVVSMNYLGGVFAGLVASAVALVLGLAALGQIGSSRGRLAGHGPAVAAVTLALIELLGVVWLLGFVRMIQKLDQRMECGTNLSGIGKAMLIYANDYSDEMPLAGGQGTTWSPRLNNWAAASRSEAFGLDPNNSGGQATISSSLYLLVRYGGVTPKSFICQSDRGTRRFDPNRLAGGRRDAKTLWDFGPDPVRHCSYAYQMVYGLHKLTTSGEPGMAIAADRNPWMDSPSAKAKDFPRFKPDISPFNGTTDQSKHGNTFHHEGDGQNVLFLDSHVEFAKRAYCGLDDDNIYTISTSQTAGDPMGTPPRFGSQPANGRDSLLVNDPPTIPGTRKKR
jgi:hypothetical protein